MRVAVVETQAHGGLLHYAVQLGDALAERGNEVDLIVPRGNELTGRARHARMRAVLTATVREPPTSVLAARGPARVARRAGVATRLVRAWLRVLFEVLRGRYDVVIVDADLDPPPSAVAAFILTRIARRTPITHVCHNAQSFSRGEGDEMIRNNRFTEAMLSRTYPRFATVFVHGERTRAEFEAVWPSTRLAVIPHGDERIFAETPPPPSPEEHILFFGFWRKVKGIMLLLDAFDEIAARRPEARLTLAGTPYPEDVDVEAIRRWADRYDGRVTVIDRYVAMEEVPDLFARARVLAAPYFVGYQSGVVHVAMTMARPVVATDVGDLGQVVIDGETGFLVPPGDLEALSDALERVIADPELAESLGAGARRRVLEGSSWEKVAERVEGILETVVDHR
jgi:glycosyltransferase involved in cell wall biosynthesis